MAKDRMVKISKLGNKHNALCMTVNYRELLSYLYKRAKKNFTGRCTLSFTSTINHSTSQVYALCYNRGVLVKRKGHMHMSPRDRE